MDPLIEDDVLSGRFEGAFEENQSLDRKSERDVDLLVDHPYEEHLFVVVC
jgi:hypothetical protein